MSNNGHAGELKLAPIGNAVVFENESVRVWSVDLEPGAKQAMHQHLLPYLIIPLTEGRNTMTFLSGRIVETNEQPGVPLWREPGEPHELLNSSGWRYRNVLVEIKRPDASETPET